MTTQEVADKFMELANHGKYNEIQDKLYADNCVSIEPENSNGMNKVEGLQAIKEKGKKFSESIEEMHSGFTGEPIVAGNYFSLAMGFDATMKGMGRMKMEEISMYEVKDGKIIKEQFFF